MASLTCAIVEHVVRPARPVDSPKIPQGTAEPPHAGLIDEMHLMMAPAWSRACGHSRPGRPASSACWTPAPSRARACSWPGTPSSAERAAALAQSSLYPPAGAARDPDPEDAPGRKVADAACARLLNHPLEVVRGLEARNSEGTDCIGLEEHRQALECRVRRERGGEVRRAGW